MTIQEADDGGGGVGVCTVDIKGLTEDRTNFAEAVVRYKAREKWYLTYRPH